MEHLTTDQKVGSSSLSGRVQKKALNRKRFRAFLFPNKTRASDRRPRSLVNDPPELEPSIRICSSGRRLRAGRSARTHYALVRRADVATGRRARVTVANDRAVAAPEDRPQ